MVLSQTAEYALRAVLYIAGQPEDAQVRVVDIAQALDVPRNYLSKTLHQLAREGVLTSTRGPHGGFRLAVPAAELSVGEVVEPFDGSEDRRQCLLGRKVCSDTSPCQAHARWRSVTDELARFFRETTVAALRSGNGASRASAGAPGAQSARG